MHKDIFCIDVDLLIFLPISKYMHDVICICILMTFRGPVPFPSACFSRIRLGSTSPLTEKENLHTALIVKRFSRFFSWSCRWPHTHTHAHNHFLFCLCLLLLPDMRSLRAYMHVSESGISSEVYAEVHTGKSANLQQLLCSLIKT